MVVKKFKLNARNEIIRRRIYAYDSPFKSR